MKKLVVALVCVTLFVTLPLGPWQHVHDHGHDAHHRTVALHAHQAGHPSAPVWRTHGPDEDARTVDAATGTVARHGNDLLVAPVETLVRIEAPQHAPAPSPRDVASGHDPPTRVLLIPRGPPRSPSC